MSLILQERLSRNQMKNLDPGFSFYKMLPLNT